jgi:hypothetical protein
MISGKRLSNARVSMFADLPCLGAPPSRRIVAAGIPGVAAADSPDAPQGAADRPVLPHRADEILAATRLEAAAAAQQRANRPLVEPHQADQQQAGDAQQPA